MRTSNPTLNSSTFENMHFEGGLAMTLSSTINKCFLMFALLLLGASWAWKNAMGGALEVAWYIPAVLGAFLVALAVTFKKTWAPTLAPLYAVLEGLTLGVISVYFEQQFPGIVLQAVLGTFSIFFALLALYKMGFIVATEKFKLGLFAVTGGIMLAYLLTMVLHFFHVNVPFIYESGTAGIIFSVFVSIVAALNLVLDFDLIEQGVKKGAPKYMEWYAAFALTVTLAWLYLEILRLLSKMRRK